MTTQAPTTNGNGNAPTAPTFNEAPASATLRVVTPTGYEVLLTTRAVKMFDLLGQLATLESWLAEHQWTPAPTGRPASKASQGNAANSVPGDAPLCPTHQKPMKPGKGGGWYCPVKLLEDDGTGKPVYCKQRK